MKNIQNHTLFMSRCIQLASKGIGFVAPNPLVGSVIVYNDEIIGEGFHQNFGGLHAEVNAIDSVKDKTLIEKSTLYVNLEPCAHFGKTPPCSDLIIRNGIKKVVIGMQDPFSKVNGAGINKLQEAGVEVTTGILEDDCKSLNKRFITYHEKRRPYIILKWAESKDGFIGKENERIQISNELSKVFTHKWRSEESAILVGSKTARIDNPYLNVRDWNGPNPKRIIFDNTGNLPANLNIFDGTQKTIVISNIESKKYSNVDFIFNKNNSLNFALNELANLGIQSILVEGGRKTLQSFIENNFWDEARVFRSENLLVDGIHSPYIKSTITKIEKLNNNILTYFKNPLSL